MQTRIECKCCPGHLWLRGSISFCGVLRGRQVQTISFNRGFNSQLTRDRSLLFPMTSSKRVLALPVVCLFISAVLSFAADGPQSPAPADPYKAVLDKLESLSVVPVPDWRFHADVPHPEDPMLDDSAWGTVKSNEKWSSGPRVFRTWIEVPEKLNGYSLAGAKVRLDLTFDSDSALTISIFSNGGLVYHGSDSSQQPVVLTQNAQPGQKFLVAARLNAAEVPTRISASRLLIEAPSSRPSPSLLRDEIVAARPIIAAYEEGEAEREAVLDAAVKRVKFRAVGHGG